MLQDVAAWKMTDPGIGDAILWRASSSDCEYTDADDNSGSGGSLGRPPPGTAIIPVGSIEQHGPHLPVSTDSIIASEVARMVSDKCGYLLLPVMPYGVSYEHAPLFHASIAGGLLRAALLDLGSSLGSYGVRHLVVVNGHHGNMDALDGLDIESDNCNSTKDNPAAAGASMTTGVATAAQMHVFHYWRHMGQDLGHAGFAETSMMLAISPELVRLDLAQKGLVTDGMPDDEVRRLSEVAKESFVRATGNGIWGDPAGATASAGRLMLEAAADAIANTCKNTCGRRADY